MNFYLGISMNPLASFFPIPIIAYDQKKDTWKSANRTLFRLLSVYIIVVALLLLLLLQACRSQGCRGGANSPPNFGRSFNPISTRRGRLCPPHYYWHPLDYKTFLRPGAAGSTKKKKKVPFPSHGKNYYMVHTSA